MEVVFSEIAFFKVETESKKTHDICEREKSVF